MTPKQAVGMHFFQKKYNIKRVNRFGIRRSKTCRFLLYEAESIIGIK